jgi:hypothetical protein
MPFWSPDGKSLFMISKGAMYRVPVSPQGDVMRAGTPERLFDVDANSDSSYQELSLHPSGEKFLMRFPESDNERREIGVVPGWAASLGEDR